MILAFFVRLSSGFMVGFVLIVGTLFTFQLYQYMCVRNPHWGFAPYLGFQALVVHEYSILHFVCFIYFRIILIVFRKTKIMEPAFENGNHSYTQNIHMTLSEVLSYNLEAGWCYFLIDDVNCVNGSGKVVNLVNFESPLDPMDLFSHNFCITTLVTFSVDTSESSFWERETSFNIVVRVGPGRDQVQKWVFQSNIGSLRILLGDLKSAQAGSYGDDSKEIDVPVKEERDMRDYFTSLANEQTPISHQNEETQFSNAQNMDLLKIENSEESLEDERLNGKSKTETKGRSGNIYQESKLSNGDQDHDDSVGDVELFGDVSLLGGSDSSEIEFAGVELDEGNVSASGKTISSALDNPKELLECEECNQVFKSKRGLDIHTRLSHSALNINCCHCRLTFRSENALSTHMRLTHADILEAGKEMYECGECSITFTSTSDWRAHLDSKKKKRNQVESKCSQCDKVYKSRTSLAAHRWRSHGKGKEKYIAASEDDGKTYRCLECAKVFSCENKLTIHSKMVHTEEEVQCDQCPKKCKNRYYLNSHKWNSHGNGKGRPRVEKLVFGIFQCDQCSNVYYNKRALRLHRNKKHSTKEKPKGPKKFVPEAERTCHICQKVLLCKKTLSQHHRYSKSENMNLNHFPRFTLVVSFEHFSPTSVHSESTKFSCSVCALSFNCRTKLNAHMMQHTGELDCPFCEKTFKWKHSLTDHIRAHKGNFFLSRDP